MKNFVQNHSALSRIACAACCIMLAAGLVPAGAHAAESVGGVAS